MATELEAVQSAALLFPDYDALRIGLVQPLYESERAVQDYFEQAAHITTLNVTRLLFHGSETELRSLPEAYILLFLVQASIVEYLRTKNIVPTQVGGIGLGIYGALFAVQAYTFPDGLYMLSKWAAAYNDFLHEKNIKKIQLTNITEKEMHKSLKKYDEVVASEKIAETIFKLVGPRSAVEAYEEELAKKYSDVVVQEVPTESGLYADIAPEAAAHYKQYLEKVEFADAQVPCFSPCQAEDLVSAQQIKDFMAHQPFAHQDQVQLLDRYEDVDTLIVPFADDALYERILARFPKKNIIKTV